MLQKVFENDLVAIHKSKVILQLNKPAFVGMCILDISILDSFVTNKMLEKLYDVIFSNDGTHLDEDPYDCMDLNTIDHNNISLDDDNFHEDYPTNLFLVRLITY